MNRETLEFTREHFRQYYVKAKISSPVSLEKREWGFIFFDPEVVHMRRHIAFQKKEDFRSYLKNLAPAHVYYSTAYYTNPDAPQMKEKGWAGADLIFDLDADHIKRGSYEIMLLRVKEELIKLLSMLTDELGFRESSIEIVFSGGRGYHIHIRDPAVSRWGSAERRELIDYICGTGIEPAAVLKFQPDPTGKNWKSRLLNSLKEYLLSLDDPDSGAIESLKSVEGMPKKIINRFLEQKEFLSATISSGDLSGEIIDPGLKTVISALLTKKEGYFQKILDEHAARADEPVTTDIKRLIRMPTSLHGGTGLKAMKLDWDHLQEFRPLNDAVAFDEREVRVELIKAFSGSFLENSYNFEKGPARVPESMAIFLFCRGYAELGGSI